MADIESTGLVKKGAYRASLKALLPYGMLATKKWLAAQGISGHALDNAIKSEVLLPLTSGVYSQYTRNLRWEGVVASLQRMQMGDDDSESRKLQSSNPERESPGREKSISSIHAGGLTALELSGLSQYLSVGNTQIVHLYSHDKLPTWLARLSLSARFEGHSTKGLWPESVMQNSKYVKTQEWAEGLPPVYASCTEKAMLEVLSAVPKTVSFEHADELMQGLVNLSPGRLDELLEACSNIKVKRLFFWLAQRQNYSWFKKLDQDKYYLGSGKRVLAKGGKLDKDYLITVPRHMVSGEK